MAVDFDLESIEGVAVGIACGPLTLEEIKESAATMLQKAEAPQTRVLWDLRGARFDLEADEVRSLAEFIKRISAARDLRTAFVVSRDLEFGLLRMFEVFRETDCAATSTFRDKQQAVEWLTNEG